SGQSRMMYQSLQPKSEGTISPKRSKPQVGSRTPHDAVTSLTTGCRRTYKAGGVSAARTFCPGAYATRLYDVAPFGAWETAIRAVEALNPFPSLRKRNIKTCASGWCGAEIFYIFLILDSITPRAAAPKAQSDGAR